MGTALFHLAPGASTHQCVLAEKSLAKKLNNKTELRSRCGSKNVLSNLCFSCYNICFPLSVTARWNSDYQVAILVANYNLEKVKASGSLKIYLHLLHPKIICTINKSCYYSYYYSKNCLIRTFSNKTSQVDQATCACDNASSLVIAPARFLN